LEMRFRTFGVGILSANALTVSLTLITYVQAEWDDARLRIDWDAS
jgi:hypothetical protein